jgi:hypothetical protein
MQLRWPNVIWMYLVWFNSFTSSLAIFFMFAVRAICKNLIIYFIIHWCFLTNQKLIMATMVMQSTKTLSPGSHPLESHTQSNLIWQTVFTTQPPLSVTDESNWVDETVVRIRPCARRYRMYECHVHTFSWLICTVPPAQVSPAFAVSLVQLSAFLTFDRIFW